MTWIAEGVARRAYRRFGGYLADEWRAFGQPLGVRFELSDRLPEWLPALRVERSIVLRRGMPAGETAWWAWHELAHVLLHPGNLLAPVGWPLPAKQERQADEFAARFPLWDVPDVTFDGGWPRVLSWDGESERRFVGCPWGGGA